MLTRPSNTLFHEYQQKCFSEIHRHLNHQTPSVKIVCEMGVKYASWIKELDAAPDSNDRRKTIVLLKWHQVHSFVHRNLICEVICLSGEEQPFGIIYPTWCGSRIWCDEPSPYKNDRH